MALGPIELLVVKFPGNQFKGEIAPALKDLIDRAKSKEETLKSLLGTADVRYLDTE